MKSKASSGLALTSLDLNPAENLWCQTKNLQKHKKTTSKAGLKKIVQKVWINITPKYLQSLYKSMPQCVQAAVDAKDSDTKYQMRSDMFAIHF